MERRTVTVIAVVTALAILGLGAYAFAGRGQGYGGCPGWGGRGGGLYQGGSGGQGNLPNDLSDEQLKAIETERLAFRKATEDLRNELFTKELELRSELANKDPDVKKASELQKEVSGLQARLDEKRIEHLIKMRKINPVMGQGYGRGYGKGYHGRGGKGMGYGRGSGGCAGPGSCWQ